MSSLPSFFFFFFACLISSFFPSHAFDITKILDQQGGFGKFNNLLTQTQLAADINSRQTVTVLVVSDDNLSQLSTQPLPTIKKTLSLHVVLDYLDTQKLQNLNKKSAILTTLFQTTGQARGQQGFLNVTVMNSDVTFGAAVPGSTLGARLVKPVILQPYSLSVLQVSGVIMMDATPVAPTVSPAPPTASPKNAPPPGNGSTTTPPAPILPPGNGSATTPPAPIPPSAPPTGSSKGPPSPGNGSAMSPPAPISPAPTTGSSNRAPSPGNAPNMSPPAPISPSASPSGSSDKAPSPENASAMSPPAAADSPGEASSSTADGPAGGSSDQTSAPNKVSQINPWLAAAFLPLLLHVCLVM